ncbi:hypothetical protein [Erwinia phage Pecta]|nr:hypothetical protein [Erwinia phage Pecta]
MDLHERFSGVFLPSWVTYLMSQDGNARYVYALSESALLPYAVLDDGSLVAQGTALPVSKKDFDRYQKGEYGCHVVEYVTQLEND